MCMHVAAPHRGHHALSIFGDHSDINAARSTGFAMLSSNSVQEAHDMACIGTAAALKSRIPTVHFFDGFRTSHEVAKISILSDDDLRFMIDEKLVREHRARALSPERPVLRGSAQNPDVFFQARETVNPFYAACPDLVQAAMDRFASRVGRAYRLFDYAGHPEADKVVVLMGSGAETAHETVDWMNAKGARPAWSRSASTGPSRSRPSSRLCPRPCATSRCSTAPSGRAPWASLYLDIVTALSEAKTLGLNPPDCRVIGGRYGLSSKEFTPAMVKSVFDELGKDKPKNHFTVGIVDDVSHTSLEWDRDLDIEGDDVNRSVFFGLGADGTVGANKNSIKIIGEETPQHAQGYFVYDSKKTGAMTISHLRFGPKPIRSIYLIKRASFVACTSSRSWRNSSWSPRAACSPQRPYAADRVDVMPRGAGGDHRQKLKFYTIGAASRWPARTAHKHHHADLLLAISGVLPPQCSSIKGAIKRIHEGPEGH